MNACPIPTPDTAIAIDNPTPQDADELLRVAGEATMIISTANNAGATRIVVDLDRYGLGVMGTTVYRTKETSGSCTLEKGLWQVPDV